MKTSLPAALVTALFCASPPAYRTRPAARKPGVTRHSSRCSPAEEIALLGQAWGLSAPRVVDVLVFLRSLLHNELVSRGQPGSALAPGDAEVLLGYARWIDGFPDVIRALPDAVLMEEAVVVSLKVPSCLTADLVPFVPDVRAGLADAPRPQADAPVAPERRRAFMSPTKGKGRDDWRSQGFVKNAACLSPKPFPMENAAPKRASTGHTGRRHP